MTETEWVYNYPERFLTSKKPLSDRFLLVFDIFLTITPSYIIFLYMVVILSVAGLHFVAVLIGASIVWGTFSTWLFLRIRRVTSRATKAIERE